MQNPGENLELPSDQEIDTLREERPFGEVMSSIRNYVTKLERLQEKHSLAEVEFRWMQDDGRVVSGKAPVGALLLSLRELATITDKNDPRYKQAANFSGYTIVDDGEDKFKIPEK